MDVKRDFNINNFEFWSGAKDTLATVIEHGKLEELEELISNIFYDRTPTETEVNDFVWFDDDYIFESLGIEL